MILWPDLHEKTLDRDLTSLTAAFYFFINIHVTAYESRQSAMMTLSFFGEYSKCLI